MSASPRVTPMLKLLIYAFFAVATTTEKVSAQPVASPVGLKQPDKTVLMSSGAIVVNGKVLEKVVLTADSKGPIDWDYDEEAFPPERAELSPLEKKLILFPIAKGTYRVRLLLWEEKRFQKITLIILGTGPQPPPGPPEPIPPPLDAFQTALQAAYVADGKPASPVARLAAIYKNSDATVNNPARKTDKEIIDVMHAAIESVLPRPILGNTRDAIRDELNRMLGKSNQALTPDIRGNILTQFHRIQAALEQLK